MSRSLVDLGSPRHRYGPPTLRILVISSYLYFSLLSLVVSSYVSAVISRYLQLSLVISSYHQLSRVISSYLWLSILSLGMYLQLSLVTYIISSYLQLSLAFSSYFFIHFWDSLVISWIRQLSHLHRYLKLIKSTYICPEF